MVVKDQRGRSKSTGPKKDQSASSSDACYNCRKPGHTKKNYFRHKEMLKKKGDRILIGLIPVESQNKSVLLKKQMIIRVRHLNQERKSTQMLGYLTQGAHTTCVQKENSSALISLMMEAFY